MPRQKGPKKVRIPGTNRWVVKGSPEEMAATVARAGALNPSPPPVPDDFDESGWEEASDLGARPEPTPKAPEPEHDIPHYYHAYMPHLRVRRGRKNALRWRGGVIYPRTPDQEQRVRDALRKYVPGGDPDRWKGDNLPKEIRCAECGYFTRNFQVWEDHMQHTGHGAGV